MIKDSNPNSKKNQTVLITGASSGIGLDFAHLFAKDGYNLVLVARSGDKLEHLTNELIQKYNINCKPISCDLSQPGAAKELFRKTQSLDMHIDFLINNAGFGAMGFFHEIDLNTQTNMIQVNITSLTELTHIYLKPMLQKKFGKILNVASTAAFQPGPLMTVYYATKAFVLSFSEALDNELSGSGVNVTVLCPGPTMTGFQSAAKIDASSKIFNSKIAADSQSVALAGYKALIDSQRLIIPGVVNKIGACSVKFVPRYFATSITRWLQEKRV
ncbi:SDR family NAD(P)-dependent oxidoreductase [Silvanigrella paludirubra]|jgi:short-subunit dehydrogenase|uniref:SDR family NAD(P)-dependent oxidoreductase n=1 Tax=Silvanigrella paludirubra TaxID=2499159 RepID=A0A6N6VXT3_9BACT|nr:SDR family oxidoreductase [Silvanigrella paludirubra]KAB8040944.1 SDR family NAD(P)-dependent oxidoreductase [Silvanigrella paludirubra]